MTFEHHQTGRYIAALFMFAGIATMFSSLFVPAPSQVRSHLSIARGVSTTPSTHRFFRVPSNIRSGQPEMLNISFDFSSDRFIDDEYLIQVGSANDFIAVDISSLIDGSRYLLLTSEIKNSTLHQTTFVLVPHLRNARPYSVAIEVSSNGRMSAWVDAKQVLFYDFPQKITFPYSSAIAIGAQFKGEHPFDGRITALQISMVRSRQLNAASWQNGLMLWGIFLLVLGAFLLVLALFKPWRRSAAFGTRAFLANLRNALSARHRRLWLLTTAIALVVFGALLLQYITPPSNVILTNVGEQQIAPRSIHVGERASYYLADEPRLFRQAAALDVDLYFDIRAVAYPIHSTNVPVLIEGNPKNYDKYFELELSDGGLLFAQIPLVSSPERWPTALGVILPKKWVSAEITQSRSQLIQMRLDGRLVFMYNTNTPEFATAPVSLQLGVARSDASVQFRNVRLTVKEYRSSKNTDGALRIRLLQLLAMLMIIAGTLVGASELFRRLIPHRRPKGKALVNVAFGVAGAGIVADTLYLLGERQSVPYYSDSTWLFSLPVRFSDFFQTLGMFLSRNPYGYQRGNYPPFGYVLIAPVSWMSGYPALIAVCSLFLGFMIWWLLRAFCAGMALPMKLAVVAIGLLCLPTTFALDRGNTALLVVMLLILGGAALEERRGSISAIYFALAGAAKVFPLGYLLLFLRKRQVRYLVVGILVAVGATVASSFLFPGTIASQLSAVRLNNDFVQNVGNASSSTPFNTSLVGWVQAIGYAINGEPGGQAVANGIRGAIVYEEFIGAILVISYLVFLERVEWRAVTVVTCAILLLQAKGPYYDLLYVFVPLALFVREAEVNRRTIFIACLFGLTLAPKSYAFFGYGPIVDSSVLVTAPILLLLLATVLWDCVANRSRQMSDADPAQHELHRAHS